MSSSLMRGYTFLLNKLIDEMLLDKYLIINETYFLFLEHRSARSVVINRMKEASIRLKLVAEVMS